MSKSFSIKSSERVLIAGKTGSGKTYLATQLLKSFDRLIVVDPKAKADPDNSLANSWGLQPFTTDAVSRQSFRVVIDDIEHADRAFHAAYHAKDCIVYVDEGYALFNPDASRKDNSNALRVYTQGRSLGVGVWLSVQRPTWLPMYVISEVEHIFCFRLRLESDRKRLAEAFAPEFLEAPKGREGSYPFWYYNDTMDSPHLYLKVPKSENVVMSNKRKQ